MNRATASLSALLLAMLVLLAACGRAADQGPPPMPSGPADGASGNASGEGDWDAQGASFQSMITDGITSGQVERLIVRNGTLRLQVSDVQQSSALAEEIANDLEGYVLSSDIHGLPDEPTAVIRVRVPAEHFSDAMRRLREMADSVLSEETSSDDVTEEYVDLSARLRNQQDVEQQLTALLERADTVSDVLSVQRELTDVREEVERLQGRIQFLEQAAAQSTITVRLNQPAAAVRLTTAWEPGATLESATAALMTLFRGLGNVAIVAGVFAPVWVPIGIGGLWWYRRQNGQAASRPIEARNQRPDEEANE